MCFHTDISSLAIVIDVSIAVAIIGVHVCLVIVRMAVAPPISDPVRIGLEAANMMDWVIGDRCTGLAAEDMNIPTTSARSFKVEFSDSMNRPGVQVRHWLSLKSVCDLLPLCRLNPGGLKSSRTTSFSIKR